MSWFDAAGFANLAKTALKEAQKTIDKALDIKDEEAVSGSTHQTPVDANSDDFFSSWGVNQIEPPKAKESSSPEETVVTKSPTKSTKMNLMSASLWGSFTGSFFESPKSETGPEKTVQHTMSVESLADDSSDLGNIDEKFSRSKLVVREISEDGEGSMRSRLSSSEPDVEEEKEAQYKSQELLLANICEPSGEPDRGVKKRERPNSFHSNRLSVISCDSGKNSSESVEVLGGTGCTTTPDSELTSIGQSVSTSSSTLGTKPTSESVEVLPDSLTSPSSIEILGSEATNSHRLSQITDEEFESPFHSPVEKITLTEDMFKTSPDSVEIIPENLEEEEQSIDDSISYLSISESTDATVLEPVKIERYDINKSKLNLGESITSELSLSPDKGLAIGEPITQAPSRSSTHLTLTHTSNPQPLFSTISAKDLARNAQTLINTQPQGSAQVFTNILESLNVIDIPSLETSATNSIADTQNESNDEGSQSDKTLIADSECGGMESSTEETSTATGTTTNSYYLKNMLADAMIEKSQDIQQSDEKSSNCSDSMMVSCQSEGLENISMSTLDMPPREQSPISSESRSDLVKIGSEQTSGHTSGDELETATSSDIEIISSPNGDSSSAQSLCRHTPTKLQKSKCMGEPYGKIIVTKVKGHNRELSEASSHSDDSHSSEIDRLLKRISEMTEILEAREAKLIDTTRKNAELQEMNTDLRNHLDSIISKQTDSTDLSLVTEEYTQRLSALERKFQQAIREKDILRKQLEQAKQEAATRMSKGELETLLGEKDEIIKELREEGEKLSKQHLQHSNIIKKLRTKEKENEVTIKNMKERLEELNTETDRLKRSLAAKEEVERSQIDAVHQLTARNKKLENDTNQLKSQLEDTTQKLETTKKSLDAAKKELTDNNRANTELQAKQTELDILDNEKRVMQLQHEEIMNQLDDLRLKLRNAEQDNLKKEQVLKKENTNLMRRLEDAEARNEELAQSVSVATRPLIRQLESLQATHSMKQNTWETLEQNLLLKLNDTQDRLSALTDKERSAREECLTLRSTVISLETKINTLSHQLELNSTQLDQQKADNMLALQDINREKNALFEQHKNNEKELEELKREISSLKDQLAIEKFKSDELRNLHRQESLQDTTDYVPSHHESSVDTHNTSPTQSLRRLSFSESVSSAAWPQDENLETASLNRYSNVFEIENLQSALKQRDGEIQQLQWDLSRRENERTFYTSEISNLMVKLESLEQRVTDFNSLKTQFEELQQQYDALCQMYGEKVEENQELHLDLQDVKEMYKSQIDELLQQNKNNH